MSPINLLRRSGGLRQAGLLTAVNLSATALSAIALIVISRLLGPFEFGLFSVAFALSILLSKVADFGLNQSLQKYVSQAALNHQDKAKLLITYTTAVKVIAAIILVSLSFIIAPLIGTSLLSQTPVSLITTAIALSSVVLLFEHIISALQGLHRLRAVALLSFLQSGTKLALSFGFYYLNLRSAGPTFLWYSLGPIPALFIGLFLLKDYLIVPVSWNFPGRDRLITMAKFAAVSTGAMAIADQLDTLLVQYFTNTYQTGLFAAAARVSLFLSMVAYSVGAVLNIRVARYMDDSNMRRYLPKALSLSLITFAATFLIIPFAPLMINLTAGPEYLEATQALKLLLTSSMVLVATVPLVAVFYAVEKPGYFALSGLLSAISLLLLYLVLTPAFGIEGASWARLASRFLTFVFTLFYVSRLIKKHYRFTKKDFENPFKPPN